MDSPLYSILRGSNVRYEQSTYNWMMMFSALYTVHLIITTQNRNYISVLLLFLGLLGYNVYKTNFGQFDEQKESDDEYINQMITRAQIDDQTKGDRLKKYTIAKALIKSDPIILSWLKKFKRLGMNQKESYHLITTYILRFYQTYGVMLKFDEKVKTGKVSLDDLVVMRQQIMNLINQFQIQVVHVQSIDHEVKQFALVVLASLNRCLKVIRNKYQLFNMHAPYAQNNLGDIYEMF